MDVFKLYILPTVVIFLLNYISSIKLSQQKSIGKKIGIPDNLISDIPMILNMVVFRLSITSCKYNQEPYLNNLIFL